MTLLDIAHRVRMLNILQRVIDHKYAEATDANTRAALSWVSSSLQTEIARLYAEAANQKGQA